MYPDVHADTYAHLRACFTATDDEVHTVLDTLGLQNKLVLDIGCGDGRHTEWFIARGASSVVGVDNSPRMVARARKRALVGNVQYLNASATALPLRDAAFDVAFSYFTLHHILTIQDALREVYRVLAPGGTFLSVFGAFEFAAQHAEPKGEFGPVELHSTDASIVMRTVTRSVGSMRTSFLEAGFRLQEFRSIPNADARMHHSHPYRHKATLVTTLAIAEK